MRRDRADGSARGGKRWIVRVTGDRPSAVANTLGPYLTENVARMQAIRFCGYGMKHGTDWVCDLYYLDFENDKLEHHGVIPL